MKIFHPDQFQGCNQTKNYFEGWYYKIVNADETKAFAVIPGIALDRGTTKQSFIQVLDGKKCKASYFKFPLESFTSHPKKFEISIGKNNFSSDRIELDLDQITGSLYFDGNVQWPVKWYSPGIMRPFAFVPFMECYHGIVSMDHRILGELTIDGEKINFDNGRGYIEKD
jgi:tocopherol cyclase